MIQQTRLGLSSSQKTFVRAHKHKPEWPGCSHACCNSVQRLKKMCMHMLFFFSLDQRLKGLCWTKMNREILRYNQWIGEKKNYLIYSECFILNNEKGAIFYAWYLLKFLIELHEELSSRERKKINHPYLLINAMNFGGKVRKSILLMHLIIIFKKHNKIFFIVVAIFVDKILQMEKSTFYRVRSIENIVFVIEI